MDPNVVILASSYSAYNAAPHSNQILLKIVFLKQIVFSLTTITDVETRTLLFGKNNC